VTCRCPCQCVSECDLCGLEDSGRS
jgi:hypothetical protein